MSFLLPLIGAVVGAVAGFSLGEMMQVGYGGAPIYVGYPFFAVGTPVCYFIGRLGAY